MTDALQASLRIASSGLHAQSTRMRVVSENLANARSTGATPAADPYRRKTVTFESELDRASGASLVEVSDIGVDRRPFRLDYDPAHPAANEAGYVRMPNVDMLIELADMREASRSYQANLQVIRQARGMISMTIDLLRS